MWCRNARGLVGGSAGSQGPDGWASVPRATLGTGTGSGPWREGTGNTKPPKTNRQQNEVKNKTKAQSHKRGNKQKPANPRLEETKTNKE